MEGKGKEIRFDRKKFGAKGGESAGGKETQTFRDLWKTRKTRLSIVKRASDNGIGISAHRNFMARSKIERDGQESSG